MAEACGVLRTVYVIVLEVSSVDKFDAWRIFNSLKSQHVTSTRVSVSPGTFTRLQKISRVDYRSQNARVAGRERIVEALSSSISGAW